MVFLILQILRDLLFMSSDILILAVSLYEIQKYAVKIKRISLARFLVHRSIMISSIIMFISLYVFSSLCPYE